MRVQGLGLRGLGFSTVGDINPWHYLIGTLNYGEVWYIPFYR